MDLRVRIETRGSRSRSRICGSSAAVGNSQEMESRLSHVYSVLNFVLEAGEKSRV